MDTHEGLNKIDTEQEKLALDIRSYLESNLVHKQFYAMKLMPQITDPTLRRELSTIAYYIILDLLSAVSKDSPLSIKHAIDAVDYVEFLDIGDECPRYVMKEASKIYDELRAEKRRNINNPNLKDIVI